MKKILLALPVVLLIATGCGHNSSSDTSQNTTPTTSSTAQSTTPADTTPPVVTKPATSSSSSGSGTVVKPNQTPVAIKNYAFSPANLTVKKGTTVIWINEDNAAHTVVSTNGGPVSANIPGGTSFTYTFTKVGTYTYHCSLHTQMTGSVTVTN